MIKFEKHKLDCTCSYCNDASTYKALHYGLNIPGQWYAWNAWYVIKYWPGRYIRWTNSWFRWFMPSISSSLYMSRSRLAAQSEPNVLTQETIEKSERGEDVKSFDTVEELFKDLNN